MLPRLRKRSRRRARPCCPSAESRKARAAAPCAARRAPGRRARAGPPRTMADKAKVAIFISGAGSNMAALLYASRLPDCPYDVVLVASNDPDAPGLALAEAEGVV